LAKNKLSDEKKIHIAKDVCIGMIFLGENLVVHRDLSARNILLRTNMTAVIADFGYSKFLKSPTDMIEEDSAVGPIKWMAPESIFSRVYSIKTDVFSYGVTIWEFQEEKAPWLEVASLQDVIDKVGKGERLPISPGTIPVFNEIMKICWEEQPETRANFSTILKKLE